MPIIEAFEQYHFFVAVTYNGITIPTSLRLELKSLNRSETCILNADGYIFQLGYAVTYLLHTSSCLVYFGFFHAFVGTKESLPASFH